MAANIALILRGIERLLVADNLSAARPRTERLWFVLRRMRCSCSSWRQICANLRAKKHQMCAFQNSDLLCFQPLLSFVPTILVFLCNPLEFPRSDNFETWCIRGFQAAARTSAAPKKGRILHLMRALCTRFEFVLSSFSASFQRAFLCFQRDSGFVRIIFINFQPPFHRAPRPFPESLSSRGSAALAYDNVSIKRPQL